MKSSNVTFRAKQMPVKERPHANGMLLLSLIVMEDGKQTSDEETIGLTLNGLEMII